MSNQPIHQLPSPADTAKGTPAYLWALVVALIAGLAAAAGSKFGIGLPGVVSAALAVATFLPVMSGVLLFSVAARKLRADRFALWMIRSYALLCFAIAVSLVTSIFVGQPLDIKSRILPKTELVFVPLPTIDVSVSAAMCDPMPVTELAKSKNGIVEVPARHRLVFESAATRQWTNDPFDGIETVLTSSPVLIDLSQVISVYEAKGRDDAQIEGWLNVQFDKLVEKGLTNARGVADADVFEEAVRQYVRTRFIPLLRDPQKLIDGKYAKVDVRAVSIFDPRDWVARPFWKRFLINGYLAGGKLNQLMGPYFDVDSKRGENPPAKGLGYPSDSAGVGCLVAGVMLPVAQGDMRAIPLGQAQEFCIKGQFVENASDQPVFVRMGINDRLPDDNGRGFATVTYRIEAVTPKQ